MKINKLTLFITLASAASIYGALAYNDDKTQEVLEATRSVVIVEKVSAPEVAIVNVKPNNYLASVMGHGEALPRYQLSLSSEVSGRVDKLSAYFVSGKQVNKGDVLAFINKTPYLEVVANAELSVADAKRELLEEERQVAQAKLEWERSGVDGQPSSPLVLRGPQLASAKAKLNKAMSELKGAELDLSNTEIVAPFDALLVSTDIQPGSYVQAGTQIAEIYSTDRIEVTIPLSAHQWQSLPAIDSSTGTPWAVTLKDASGQSQWQGIVGRIENHFDSTSRQRSLVVVVEQPLSLSEPLLAGTFVEAHIQGKELTNMWQLPASSISQSGYIWVVNSSSQLVKHKADKVFEKGEQVYIQASASLSSANVVIRPLNSYVAGTLVTPKSQILIGNRLYSQDLEPQLEVAHIVTGESR